MTGQTISHYEILEKLGEGGMGVVYKAEDTKLKRTVALKFLPHYLTSDETEKERFYHEARAASALNHQNITTIYEINEHEGRVFLAMELVEGKTLKKFIEQEQPSVKKVLEIAIQIGDGLSAAHEKGIVHRDIKSDNIMLTVKNQIKIMDFGLAKVKGSVKLTKAGSTLGTAAYMSPEQAQGEEVDRRSDIFSFGVVLYELLTGHLPFRGEHQAALMYSLINEAPQPVARFNDKVSPEIERIVDKALAKDKEDRYQHVDDLLADLRRERKNMEYARAGYSRTVSMAPVAAAPAITPAEVKPKRTIWRYLIPAAAVVAVVLMVAIFNPFNFQLSTQKSVAAGNNSIAVMYFENVADPEDQDKTAKMITSLLITGLSDSKSLNVVSTQRLYDILKQLGKEGTKVIDKGVASEVAKKAGVGIVVTGEILQTKPNIVLTAEVSEAGEGKILTAERISGASGDDIFSVVDKLSTNIKNSLLSSRQSETETNKAVADVTTHSPEAYKEYLLGVELSEKLYRQEAAEHLRKAIGLDSTFAMAYFYLASIVDDPTLRRLSIKKALQYSDRVTRRDRDFIRIMESLSLNNSASEAVSRLRDFVGNYPDDKQGYFLLGVVLRRMGDLPQSIAASTKVIELDPYYKNAYNILAYAYDEAGEFDKSIWAINKYISLAPDEANPFDTRADLYANRGKIAEATDSYRKALAVKPDFYESLEKLGMMLAYSGQYAPAESCFQVLTRCNAHNWKVTGFSDLASLASYQGKFKTAHKVLDRLMGGADGELLPSEISKAHGNHAICYMWTNDLSQAIKEAEEADRIDRKENLNGPVYGRSLYGFLLARNNELLKAEKVADDLRGDLDRNDTAQMSAYWGIVGEMERKKGNATASLAACQMAVKGNVLTFRRYMLALAYLNAGKLGEAVNELERLETKSSDVDRFGYLTTSYHYYLGIAYEKSGWTDKAISQFEQYLSIVKNADTGIPEITDAKERLARLKGKV